MAGEGKRASEGELDKRSIIILTKFSKDFKSMKVKSF